MTETIYKYALNLLKRRPYFIKEMYGKLISKYCVNEVNIVVKMLIYDNYLNDKILSKLKLDYFIYEKKFGIYYINNYFIKHNISLNLINYLIKNYDQEIFNKNKNQIVEELRKKEKTDNYINNYLLRKGYEIE